MMVFIAVMIAGSLGFLFASLFAAGRVRDAMRAYWILADATDALLDRQQAAGTADPGLLAALQQARRTSGEILDGERGDVESSNIESRGGVS